MENSDSLPIEVTDHDSRQEILKCVKDMKQDLANWMMKIENEVKLRLDRSLNAEMELLPTDTRATRQQQDHSLEMAEQTIADSTHGKSEEPLSEGEKKKLEKIEQIREKYLRLLISLGCSFEDSLAAKVLNQINIAESRSCSQTVGLHSAKKAAMELEVHTKNDLDLCLSILVIGKTGVGKSATINSILGENKMVTNAFEPATTDVTEIISTIDGIKIKFLDTPGLRTSHTDQSKNRKILLSLKKIMQKNPPDLVLYVDRLDTQTSNSDDLPLLKSITTYLGTSIWCKCIIGLTHAASLPPDGPDGYPLRYESIVDRRSGDLQGLLSHLAEEPVILPVGLVENQRGENLLLNGESWKLRLLLMCSSIKTLADLDFVIKSPIKSNLTMFGIQIPFYSKLPHSERHKNYMLDDTSSENEALTTLPPSIDPNTRSAHDHRSTLLLTWPIPTFVDGVITLVGKIVLIIHQAFKLVKENKIHFRLLSEISMGNSGSVSEQEAAETKEALKIMREFKQEVRDWVIRMEPHIDLCIDGVAEFKRKTQNDLEQLQTALRELQQQKNVTASQKIMEVQADLGETKETGGHKNVENKGDGSRFIKSA